MSSDRLCALTVVSAEDASFNTTETCCWSSDCPVSQSALTVLSTDGCITCRFPVPNMPRGPDAGGAIGGTRPRPDALQEVKHVRSVFP